MPKWISICKGRKVTIVNLPKPKSKALRWIGKILARILKK